MEQNKVRHLSARVRATFGLTVCLVVFFSGGRALPPAFGEGAVLPSFGKGPIEVRIYTDYFCPPCRNMEPALEPLLADLVHQGRIRVTFIDTPTSKNTALFARHFLYSLVVKNDFDSALSARRSLFEAAERKVVEKDRLVEWLRENGISFREVDLKGVFDFWNRLLNEDKIRSTPSCVIVNGVRKETVVGSQDVLKAVENLKESNGKKEPDRPSKIKPQNGGKSLDQK